MEKELKITVIKSGPYGVPLWRKQK